MKVNIDLKYFFNKNLGKSITSSRSFKKNLEKCQSASDKLKNEIKSNSNEIFNSWSINYQKKIRKEKKLIAKKKYTLVIGLGGSSAGTKAINSYLEKNIFFFDNYDPRYFHIFFQKYNLNNFNIYVVSKSGNTNETLAILNLTYQHLLKISNEREIRKNIIIIVQNDNNLLRAFAEQKKIKIIFHNFKIGGRYSVFSETSQILFDLSPNLVSQAGNSVIKKLLSKNYQDHSNPVLNAAIILTLQETRNINLNVNIICNYLLKNYSYWYHQLFAESLGKKNWEITPMTSIWPKDQHSMLQLYLEGSKNKFFNIFSPDNNEYFSKFKLLGLGSVERIKPQKMSFLQFKGLVKTFDQKKIPYRIITCSDQPKDKISNIFELFAFTIVETIILAYAKNINPYNQPAVELIKKNSFNS